MIDIAVVYVAIKYWGPVLGFFAIVIKAYLSGKKNVGAWANSLLTNHLAHIQDATETTVAETKKTNDLLASQALQQVTVAKHVDEVKTALSDHTDKEMQVWNGVVNTLAVLEDRTRRTPRPRRRS